MDNARIDDVLKKIERTRQARRHKFYLRDEKISLSHGSGGKATHNLIEGVFAPAFSNPLLDPMDDAATFSINGTGQRLAFTTDTYVVSPLFFPGGDIGKLAVHGTINDLAMAGAEPLYLSAGFILEEGFPISDLRRIVASMAQAASEAGVASPATPRSSSAAKPMGSLSTQLEWASSAPPGSLGRRNCSQETGYCSAVPSETTASLSCSLAKRSRSRPT